ncbi:hypothetical protein M413DRAFT_299387 [Hebeloma cylindrosporum]|uniref:Uncharacterized protein n=1 Tax=Hebeloma cylindrosporum TaxID=76867 RepID=A0A0C2YYB6_HEBCY|nr:hypothetical protein M413DRAFT_299387 [Hebeloma cylindrosporum h7]
MMVEISSEFTQRAGKICVPEFVRCLVEGASERQKVHSPIQCRFIVCDIEALEDRQSSFLSKTEIKGRHEVELEKMIEDE